MLFLSALNVKLPRVSPPPLTMANSNGVHLNQDLNIVWFSGYSVALYIKTPRFKSPISHEAPQVLLAQSLSHFKYYTQQWKIIGREEEKRPSKPA